MKKVKISKDDRNVKRIKSDDGIVEKLAYLDYFKRTTSVDMTTGKERLF